MSYKLEEEDTGLPKRRTRFLRRSASAGSTAAVGSELRRSAAGVAGKYCGDLSRFRVSVVRASGPPAWPSRAQPMTRHPRLTLCLSTRLESSQTRVLPLPKLPICRFGFF